MWGDHCWYVFKKRRFHIPQYQNKHIQDCFMNKRLKNFLLFSFADPGFFVDICKCFLDVSYFKPVCLFDETGRDGMSLVGLSVTIFTLTL